MLSISIVTFNSARTIAATLDSLQNHFPAWEDGRLIVVDNHSTDNTPVLLRAYAERWPHLTLIQNADNVGFGTAHNQALRQVTSRYHVVCNPDIVFTEDVFTPLIGFMDQDPLIGILCPRFLNPDGSLQPLNRRNPTVLDLMLRRFLPDKWRGRCVKKRMDAYEMRDVGYADSCNVPFMTGAFMFCRTEALRRVGGFDERFFLYFEDADLSRQMQARGFRTIYVPGASVTHNWERLAHRSWRMAWVFSINALRYFLKWGFRFW
jgi:hypothetical protein